jgi:acetyl-CoA synthetase
MILSNLRTHGGTLEVESTLMRHPAVAEAAVIGKPEPTIELVKAFVVLKNGREATDEMRMDILGFARKVLPSLKEIEFVESIPKTAERY